MPTFTTFAKKLRNGYKPIVTATDIAFATSGHVISATTTNFLQAGFRPGDVVLVSGADEAGNNAYLTIVSVAANGLSMTVSEALTDDAAGSSVTIACAGGKGLEQIFHRGVVCAYEGTAPTDPDAAITHKLICKFTASGLTFTPGAAANGFLWEQALNGVIPTCRVDDAQVIAGESEASGTIGFYVIYDNAYDATNHANAVRCILSRSELELLSGSLTVGASGVPLKLSYLYLAAQ